VSSAFLVSENCLRVTIPIRRDRRWSSLHFGLIAWLLLGFGVSALHANPADEEAREQYRNRLSAARTAYFKVITSNDQAADAQAHEALAELERDYPGDPVAKAYRGSLELLDAAHNWAIWNLHKQAADGLSLLDAAVAEAPDEPEARFIRAATAWHLPGFYHRKAQCEADFALLAGRAEQDARQGKLPPELAAASYNYWGQILVNRGDKSGARAAFQTAIRIAPQSPGGLDAGKRLVQLN
jgi:predicted negative regulator of RcsB-dependent stress response